MIVAYLHGVLSSELLEIFVFHHLSHDEAFLEVRMDTPGSLRRLRTDLHRPGFDLVLATGEEVAQLQCSIARENDLLQRTENSN